MWYDCLKEQQNRAETGELMATSRAAALLRKPGQPQRATFLELFFDLVFVFALSRVSQRLVEDLTSQRRIVLTEAGQTLLLLLAVYVVWFATASITDLYDPQRPEIQLLIVATMFGSLVMAVALPAAFSDRGLVFAGAYVAIHLGRGLFFVPLLRRHPAQRRAVRVLFWFAVSAVLWIAGALFPESVARGVLWTLAIGVDYTGVALRWPTPGLGRAPRSELPVVAEHLAERYRQFFTIALGELILVTGVAYSGGGFGAGPTAAFVVAFATTVLLWRIYIYRAGQLLPAAIAGASEPGRLVGLSTPAHLLMVAGIAVIAAGIELVITHPLGHTDPAWIAVILGGPALFLAGRALFEYAVFARVSWDRPIGVLVLAVVSPAMILVPPLVVAIAAALVLAGVAVSDAARARGGPPEPPTPPSS
jgi:low temperature requirement protein LtrA